ncbi:hypothetical protein [Aeromonas allosaccharophila]
MTRIDFNGTQLRLYLPCGCLITEGYREHCMAPCDGFSWSESELVRAGWHLVWASLAEEGTDLGELSPSDLATHLEPFEGLLVDDTQLKQVLQLGNLLLGKKRRLSS